MHLSARLYMNLTKILHDSQKKKKKKNYIINIIIKKNVEKVLIKYLF